MRDESRIHVKIKGRKIKNHPKSFITVLPILWPKLILEGSKKIEKIGPLRVVFLWFFGLKYLNYFSGVHLFKVFFLFHFTFSNQKWKDLVCLLMTPYWTNLDRHWHPTSYLYYKIWLILNIKFIFRYLLLKFIWVNPTIEISLEIIFFSSKTVTFFLLKVVKIT